MNALIGRKYERLFLRIVQRFEQIGKRFFLLMILTIINYYLNCLLITVNKCFGAI